MVETGSITSFESYEDARAHVSKALLASINAVQTQHADSLEDLGPKHQRAISQVFGAINKTVQQQPIPRFIHLNQVPLFVLTEQVLGIASAAPQVKSAGGK